MSEPRPSTESASAVPPARALRVWQRFHIRLMAVYGGLVIAALTCLGLLMYMRGVRSEEAALKTRLRAVAVSISQGLDPAVLDTFRTPADQDRPEFKRMMLHFSRVCDADRDITDVYVMRRGPAEQTLVFIADYVRKAEAPPGKPGETYDASRARFMIDGFTAPSVEEELYVDEWGQVLSAYAPVKDAAGQPFAIIGVDAAASGLIRMRNEVLTATLFLYGLAAVLLGLLTIGVGRNVREPLNRIIEATTAIAGGQLDMRAKLERGDEFGILGEHFDHMAKGLEEREAIRGMFGRYVSPEVARLAMGRQGGALGGEEREVTILFSDLKGYASISEKLTPPELISLLNDYLSAMQELVDAEGGTVIEFLGDAILAVFGAPNDLPDHPARAVRCALAMREKLVSLNAKWDTQAVSKVWKSAGIEHFGARIGLHTGKVVAGNLGSRTRVKYATVGDAVNVASRIENLNGALGTDLLCTGTVMDRLPDDLKSRSIAKGDHLVKGRKTPLSLFTFG